MLKTLPTSDQGFQVVWLELLCSCSIIQSRAHISWVTEKRKTQTYFYKQCHLLWEQKDIWMLFFFTKVKVWCCTVGEEDSIEVLVCTFLLQTRCVGHHRFLVVLLFEIGIAFIFQAFCLFWKRTRFSHLFSCFHEYIPSSFKALEERKLWFAHLQEAGLRRG